MSYRRDTLHPMWWVLAGLVLLVWWTVRLSIWLILLPIRLFAMVFFPRAHVTPQVWRRARYRLHT